MLGIEAFLAANIAASTAAILVGVKLAKETLIWTRRRRTIPFVLGVLSVVVLLSLDFWWTGHQKAASEAKIAQLAQLAACGASPDTFPRKSSGIHRSPS